MMCEKCDSKYVFNFKNGLIEDSICLMCGKVHYHSSLHTGAKKLLNIIGIS